MERQVELPGPVYVNVDLIDHLEHVSETETRVVFNFNIGDWPFSIIVAVPYHQLQISITRALSQ